MYNQDNNIKLLELIEGINRDLAANGGVVHFGDNFNKTLYPNLLALVSIVEKIAGKPIGGYIENAGTKTPDKIYLSKTKPGTFSPTQQTTSTNPNDSVWIGSGIVNDKVSKSGDTMTGMLNLGKGLTVTENATFNNAVLIKQTLNAGSTTLSGLSVTGEGSVGGTLTVSGNTTLSGLNVNSDATLSSLTVNGATNINNTVAISKTLNVTGVSTFTGQTVHNGGIDVNGSADISTTLTVGGNTILKGTLAVTGAITASGGVVGNSNTATTLQTARTINGTSFNGSENITTASWGTARTITIGNSGKSVNGSVDVSYTLDDIGAQPKGSYAASSHNHTKSQITDFEHTHTKGQITDFPVSLKNPTAITIKANGTSLGSYDGSAAKEFNITYGNVGAASAGHTHTAGNVGAYTKGEVDTKLNTKLNLSGGTMTGNLSGNGSNTISGFSKIYNAVWNDYAEFYERGEGTEAGDVIALDLMSDKEIYVKASREKGNTLVVGVHSNSFAHLIGGENPKNGEDFYEYNIRRFIPVGLAGRVQCKVVGEIIKGDYITLSDIDGVAKCYNPMEDSIIDIFGIALETNIDSGIKNVKIHLKR